MPTIFAEQSPLDCELCPAVAEQPAHGAALPSGSFFSRLLETEGFPPRWECGTAWTPSLGWLHIVSDFAIFGAYFAIPVVLGYFILRRKDVPFPPVLWLFVAFIAACGVGHLIEGTIFWTPWYRLSGLVKGATAVVSWVTVIALLRVVPPALELPGLAKLNEQLHGEMRQRRRVEHSLRQRAAELESRNRELAEEIRGRQQAELRLQASERQLQAKNREIQQFVYTVSHDLKAPLVTCQGFAAALQEDAQQQDWDRVLDSAGRLGQAARRMGDLIDDLLQVSRIGVVRNDPEWIDVGELARSIAQDMAPRLESAGAELQLAGDIPPVCADRLRFRQLLENLLSNAVKYGCRGEGASIELGGRRRDGTVQYFVRDDGPGIAEEHHRQIFGLFQRLQPDGDGTGVGLAAVARIAESHGGAAWVDSHPGEGATFWVALPEQPPDG